MDCYHVYHRSCYCMLIIIMECCRPCMWCVNSTSSGGIR